MNLILLILKTKTGCMSTDQNFGFITQKIMQIKTALCCIEHEAFTVRTHIVQMLYADSEGNLYFSLMKPVFGIDEVKKFAVNLTFYRKSFDYYIQLNAVAEVEPEENNSEDGHYIILKAKIMNVDYVEHAKPFSKHPVLDNFRNGFMKFTKSLAMLFY